MGRAWTRFSSVTRAQCIYISRFPVTFLLTLSLPESILETCAVLTFESFDEILWCDHSNETSSAVLLHGTICFSEFYKMKFGIFLKSFSWHSWE